MTGEADSPASPQRIDKWLFCARLARSRSLAARFVAAGKVRLNGVKIDQPAHLVRTGDVLTIVLDRQVLVLRVVKAGSRRGPAAEARQLYVAIAADRDKPAT